MCESSRAHSNSALDLQLMTQLVASTLLCLLYLHPLAPCNLPTHRSNQLSCDQMLLCDWAVLHSAAEHKNIKSAMRKRNNKTGYSTKYRSAHNRVISLIRRAKTSYFKNLGLKEVLEGS